MLFVALVLAGSELGQILSAFAAGRAPELIIRSEGAGNFVYVLDLGVVVPLVLATAATVQSHAYRTALEHLGLSATEQPCPLLVPLVEEGWLNSASADSARQAVTSASKEASAAALRELEEAGVRVEVSSTGGSPSTGATGS